MIQASIGPPAHYRRHHQFTRFRQHQLVGPPGSGDEVQQTVMLRRNARRRHRLAVPASVASSPEQ
jgi:hypothetical protein